MRLRYHEKSMGYLNRLRRYFSPPPIATADALAIFLQERASLIAQKCAIDYVRGKTGLASYALFTEKPFLDALDVCRWEAFAELLGDLTLLAEARLRPHASAEQRARVQEALLGLHTTILGSMPAPAHRPQGWSDLLASFEARFRSASVAQPSQTLELADHAAKRLFETLPIHASMRELDEEVVYGAVRFRMIAVNQELQRRLAAADIVSALSA
jgi:hypothetical protein